MTCKILGNIYLFNQLTESELEQLEAIAEIRGFKVNERIFAQGDIADSLYVIRYGSVEIRQGADTLIALRTLGSGSHFGEMVFIDGEKRSADATVMERSEIVVIRYAALLDLLEHEPAIAVKFYRSIARYLSGRLRQTAADLNFARERSLHSA